MLLQRTGAVFTEPRIGGTQLPVTPAVTITGACNRECKSFLTHQLVCVRTLTHARTHTHLQQGPHILTHARTILKNFKFQNLHLFEC